MIKITVITCTFNCAPTVASTLQSVLSQSYESVEHIIVDGASSDATLSIAEDYRRQSDSADNGHEVKVVSEPDGGLYYAMNKGLALMTGDYVVFLNSGDFFPDGSVLSDVAEAAACCDILPGVVYGETDLVDAKGRFLRHRRLSVPEHLTWKSFKEGMLVCHQAFYALADIARVTPYNNIYRFSADVDWCIRVMKETERQHRSMVNACRVVVNYLAEGMTTNNLWASLKERFRVMRSHYGLLSTLCRHAWFVCRAVFRR